MATKTKRLLVGLGVSLAAAVLGLVMAAVFYWPRFQRLSAPSFNRRLPLAYAWAHNKGYFDEDYQASQMWKQDWEAANGSVVAARARAAVEMLEPLRGPVQPQPPAGAQPTGGSPEGSPG